MVAARSGGMEFAAMKRRELLELCRQHGLATRGSKADLAASLAGAISVRPPKPSLLPLGPAHCRKLQIACLFGEKLYCQKEALPKKKSCQKEYFRKSKMQRVYQNLWRGVDAISSHNLKLKSERTWYDLVLWVLYSVISMSSWQ